MQSVHPRPSQRAFRVRVKVRVRVRVRIRVRVRGRVGVRVRVRFMDREFWVTNWGHQFGRDVPRTLNQGTVCPFALGEAYSWP